MAQDTSGHRTRAGNTGIRSPGKRTAFEPPDEGDPRPDEPGSRDIERHGAGPAAALRKVLPWGWLAGGVSVVLVALSVVFFALAAGSGFALVVRGAPRGAEVYVDGSSAELRISMGAFSSRARLNGGAPASASYCSWSPLKAFSAPWTISFELL
jgi:hypothetical protein